MSTIHSDTLCELAIAALERTAFVVAEPADEDFADDLPDCEWYSCIEYSGPQAGSIYLAGSTGFLLELAASLLGVDAEEVVAEKEGLDALREMTNIIGGSVVTRLGGDHCELSLGLPAVVSKDVASKHNSETITSTLDAEGERLEIYWVPGTNTESKAA
jgi:CheY-specific phosphatase CheX